MKVIILRFDITSKVQRSCVVKTNTKNNYIVDLRNIYGGNWKNVVFMPFPQKFYIPSIYSHFYIKEEKIQDDLYKIIPIMEYGKEGKWISDLAIFDRYGKGTHVFDTRHTLNKIVESIEVSASIHTAGGDLSLAMYVYIDGVLYGSKDIGHDDGVFSVFNSSFKGQYVGDIYIKIVATIPKNEVLIDIHYVNYVYIESGVKFDGFDMDLDVLCIESS